jgi:hypothetical protein
LSGAWIELKKLSQKQGSTENASLENSEMTYEDLVHMGEEADKQDVKAGKGVHNTSLNPPPTLDPNHSHFILVDDGATCEKAFESGVDRCFRAAFETCVARRGKYPTYKLQNLPNKEDLPIILRQIHMFSSKKLHDEAQKNYATNQYDGHRVLSVTVASATSALQAIYMKCHGWVVDEEPVDTKDVQDVKTNIGVLDTKADDAKTKAKDVAVKKNTCKTQGKYWCECTEMTERTLDELTGKYKEIPERRVCSALQSIWLHAGRGSVIQRLAESKLVLEVAQKMNKKIFQERIIRTVNYKGLRSFELFLLPTSELQSHQGITVGDAVKIIKMFEPFHFAKDVEGEVRKIVVENTDVYFYVDVNDKDIRQKIEPVHQGRVLYSEHDQTWVACKISEVQKLKTNNAALGKRSAEAQQKTQDASICRIPEVLSARSALQALYMRSQGWGMDEAGSNWCDDVWCDDVENRWKTGMTSTIGAKLCSALQDIWLHAGAGAVDERFKETLKRAEEVNKEYKANRPRSRRAYVTFKGLDTNNDGFISQDEFKSIHSRGNFKNIDVDGDGKISREEYDHKAVNNLEGKGHALRYAVFEFVCMCECI